MLETLTPHHVSTLSLFPLFIPMRSLYPCPVCFRKIWAKTIPIWVTWIEWVKDHLRLIGQEQRPSIAGMVTTAETFECLRVFPWFVLLVVLLSGWVSSVCQVSNEKVHLMSSGTQYTADFLPVLTYPVCRPCLKMMNSGLERMLS